MSSPKMANGMTEEARSPSSSKLVDEEQPKCALKCRHIFALMGFLGYINVYALRVNISVAIVGMVNNTAVLETIHAELEEGEVQEEIFFSCPVDNVTLGNTFENGTISNTTTTGPVDDGNGNGEFNWDATTQGLILGSFFWGYVFTQLPGGIIAKRFGGKWVYGIGTLLASVFALLTPVAARWGVGGVVTVRVIQGLGEGVVFPATHCLMSQWVPPLDRSRYSSFVYLGAPVGTVISLAVSGVLASSSWGWPSVFYVFGLLGVLWFVGWAFFVYETPGDHPRISDAEKREIRLSLGNSVHQESHKQDIPYKAICTSVPFWAIFVAHTCFTWGFYTLLTQIPTFMNAVLRVKLAENGLLSSLPYLAMFLVGNAGSQAIDHARSKGMRTVVARKLANSISFLIPAACLVGVSYMGCDVAGVVTVFTVCVGFFGLYHTGFNCNHLDIAPNFAGYLMGITNTAGTVSGILAPYVTGLIIDGKEHHVEQWRIVFYISAIVFFVGNTVFLLFASGEEQPWNRHGQDEEEDVEKPRKDGQKTNASMGVNGGVVNGTVNEGYQENYDGAGEANEAYIEESTKM